MSTKVIKSMSDFARFRRDIEVHCYCGHKAVLPHVPVMRKFVANNWSKGLGSALGHFRCSKCGSCPAHIGPMER